MHSLSFVYFFVSLFGFVNQKLKQFDLKQTLCSLNIYFNHLIMSTTIILIPLQTIIFVVLPTSALSKLFKIFSASGYFLLVQTFHFLMIQMYFPVSFIQPLA